MTGFQVDPAALGVTADGVQGVLDELGQLGINGEQTSGSPVENLALSSGDAGNQVVSAILGRSPRGCASSPNVRAFNA